MITKEVLQKTLDKVLALSKPPQVINEGLPTEALVYSKERFNVRVGSFPFFCCDYTTISHEEWRQRYLAENSFEEDIWKICKPNTELADAVYDFAVNLKENKCN